MKHLLIIPLVFLSFNIFSGRMMFGKDQNIHLIEPKFEIPLLDEKGYQMADSVGVPIIGKLAYLVEIQFFIAGVWVNDGGYIITNDKESFYPISEDVQKITEEYINNKFPDYSLSFFDYLFGYSLWIAIIGVIAYYKIKDSVIDKRSQRRNIG